MRFPFDAFASTFYMLSRYEEYLPNRKDTHGRFPATESIAYREGFLDKAVVNRWAEMIVAILLKRFPDLHFHKTSYQYVPTIDVDLAYSYLHKGFLRTLGGYVKSLIHADFEDVRSRTHVLMGKERDPFDSFDALHHLHSTYYLKPVFFFLFSDYGQYDKNLSIYNPAFRNLIKKVADYATVGIHPSYACYENPQKLKKEIEDLSQCLHRQITHSRQHFLRLNFPETYRNLIHCGITDDYSMGFADQPGFRAGTCNSFPFYDLDLDTATSLLIHPFAFMDGTLKDYLKIPKDQVVDFVKPYIEEVKRYSGTLITLWHNETHGGSGRWEGWPEIYETIVKMGASSSIETSTKPAEELMWVNSGHFVVAITRITVVEPFIESTIISFFRCIPSAKMFMGRPIEQPVGSRNYSSDSNDYPCSGILSYPQGKKICTLPKHNNSVSLYRNY